jgi:group I intron endonuclease
MTCGIYKITNKQTEKFYIGSSNNIERRWSAHKYRLREGVHSNKHLLSAWVKYGAESFDFSILQKVEEETLLDVEQQVIDESGCLDKKIGYNKAPFAGSPMKGKKHSKKTIEKIQAASIGRKHTEETKAKISAANTGRVYSEETRRKMSESAKKRGVLPHMFAPPSPEGRKKISEYAKARTGAKNPNARLTEKKVKEIRELFVNDTKLTNPQVAEMYGVSLSTIKRVKYGKSWRVK